MDMLGLSDVKSVDSFGPSATILSGQLGSLYGLPILVSNQVQNTLNSTGRQAAASDATAAVMFNRRSFMLAERGGLRFETERTAINGQDDLILSGRWDMQCTAPAAAVCAAVIYNITS